MSFYMPTKLHTELNCVANHARDFNAFGRKALIVTGRYSAKKCGALDDVTTALKQNNQSWAIFDAVEENPSIRTVMTAAELAVEEQVDFVIGIGGGSPMDAAKAIALMARHPEADWHYLYDSEADPTALPIICIPTTCGTGSEVTGISVLTNPEAGTKVSMVHRIFPDLSLVDGRYLQSASASMIRNTAMDALCHAAESLLCAQATIYSKMCAREGLALWAANKELLLHLEEAPLSEDDAMALMHASVTAGMALAQTGSVLPHALSYHLTYEAGIPHGKACGYFLASYIAGAPNEMVAEILQLLSFKSVDELQEFYETICGGEVMDAALLQGCVEEVFPNKRRLDAAVYPVDRQELERIARVR